MYALSPIYPASTACKIAGIEKPDRLRSWHVRDGLSVGTAQPGGGHRRYSFPDCVDLCFVKTLTDGGWSVGLALGLLDRIRAHLRSNAHIDRASLYADPFFLVAAIDGGEIAVAEVVAGACGEAGAAASRKSRMGAVLLLCLSDLIVRTQAAADLLSTKDASDV